MIEAWRKTFRDGIAPQFSTAGLEALATALENDAPELIQGATTSPPPLASLTDWPVEAACPIGLACWKGDSQATVGDVEQAFARVCAAADAALGEPAAVRWFLHWFDDTDRETARRSLLAEVRRVLTQRQGQPAPAA